MRRGRCPGASFCVVELAATASWRRVKARCARTKTPRSLSTLAVPSRWQPAAPRCPSRGRRSRRRSGAPATRDRCRSVAIARRLHRRGGSVSSARVQPCARLNRFFTSPMRAPACAGHRRSSVARSQRDGARRSPHARRATRDAGTCRASASRAAPPDPPPPRPPRPAPGRRLGSRRSERSTS